MNKVFLFTKYSMNGASSRYRFYQYMPFLERNGLKTVLIPLFSDEYLDKIYNNSNFNFIQLFKVFFYRLWNIIKIPKHSVVLIEYELYPYFFCIFEKFLKKYRKCKLIFDYDDAIFLRYTNSSNFFIKCFLKKKISCLMRLADAVIVGNEFIYNYAKISNSKLIFLIPTVVDLSRYLISNQYFSKKFVIGWIGTPKTTSYLKHVENAILRMSKISNVEIILIGAVYILPKMNNIKYLKWDLNNEINDLLKLNVGIMPLSDGLWENGKCGLKLIQYMACGLPVVASPIGVNKKIVKHGFNGYLASNEDEWFLALNKLRLDRDLCKIMGNNGRMLVEENYSLEKTNVLFYNVILSQFQCLDH